MKPEDILKLPYRPCVGVMLVNPQGLIFAGQRIDTDIPAWQMPQGGVDKGEEPDTAALRELWEETGLPADAVQVEARSTDWLAYDLPHDLVPRIWGGKYRGQEQLWYLMRFLGTDDQINIASEHPEFSTWKWIGPDELLDSIVSFKKELYEKIINEFRSRL